MNTALTIDEVYQFLHNANYYMLATVDGTQPRVRPFGTTLLYKGRIYIETLHRKRVAQQLLVNSHAELCAMNLQGDAWIRVEAVLVNDDSMEVKQAMLDTYPFLQQEIQVDNPDLALYYLQDATAWLSQEGKSDRVGHF